MKEVSGPYRIAALIDNLGQSLGKLSELDSLSIARKLVAEDDEADSANWNLLKSLSSTVKSDKSVEFELSPLPHSFVLGDTSTQIDVEITVTNGWLALRDTTSVALEFRGSEPFVTDLTALLEQSQSLLSDLLNAPRGANLEGQKSGLSISSYESEHMLGAKWLYWSDDADRRVQRLSHTESQDVFDQDIVSNPFAVVAARYKDELESAQFDYMAVSDIHWDRMIVSEALNEQIVAFGQHGDGDSSFCAPMGLAYIFGYFFVADAFNDRVVLFKEERVNGEPRLTYETEVSEGFDRPIDVAAAFIHNLDYSYFEDEIAVLDQGNARVLIYDLVPFPGEDQFVLKNEICSPGSGDFQLDRPTSLCYGVERDTHYPANWLYVADNGNHRVVLFGSKSISSEHHFFMTTPQDVFPDNAYLTSVDVDNYGYVWVVDSYNSKIYKFSENLSRLVATFGSEGLADNQLVHPKRLKVAKGYKWVGPDQPYEPLLSRDVFVTESYGDYSGVRRFNIENEVLSSAVSYLPRPADNSTDYISFEWYQVNHSYAKLVVSKPGGAVDSVMGPSIRPNNPGFNRILFPLSENAHDGYYEATLSLYDAYQDNPYQVNDTVIINTIAVSRYSLNDPTSVLDGPKIIDFDSMPDGRICFRPGLEWHRAVFSAGYVVQDYYGDLDTLKPFTYVWHSPFCVFVESLDDPAARPNTYLATNQDTVWVRIVSKPDQPIKQFDIQELLWIMITEDRTPEEFEIPPPWEPFEMYFQFLDTFIYNPFVYANCTPCGDCMESVSIDSLVFRSMGGDVPRECFSVDASRWWVARVFAHDPMFGSDLIYNWRPIQGDHVSLWFNPQTPIDSATIDSVHRQDSVFVRFDSFPPEFSEGDMVQLANVFVSDELYVPGYDFFDYDFPEFRSLYNPVFTDYCSTSCTELCDPEPSCPMLFAWTGQDFELVNNLLPQSESPGFAGRTVSDVQPVYNLVRDNQGLLQLSIREFEQEMSTIDEVALYSFDVGDFTGDCRFNHRNELVLIESQIIAPSSATTDAGEDVLVLVSEDDDRYFTAKGPGWLELDYNLPRKSVKTSLGDTGPGGGIIGGPGDPDPGKQPWKYTVGEDGDTTYAETGVTISALDGNGEWRIVCTLFPRVQQTGQVIELTDFEKDAEVRVRIEWPEEYTADFIPYALYTKPDVQPKKLPLISAFHSNQGSIATSLASTDDVNVALAPGEEIDMTFQASGSADAVETYYFLIRGQYSPYEKSAAKGTIETPEFALAGNYPNPFNPSTTFEFTLPQSIRTELVIYNVLGQRVATVIDGDLAAGSHQILWDGRLESGNIAPSGVYFAKLSAGEHVATKKIVMLK